MNYTPDALQNLVFKKTFMGYDEDEVNDALDKVIEDYNSYARQIAELKDRLIVLNESIKHYKKMEESLESTLVMARQTGEDIKTNAYEKAENVIKDAENQAQKILLDARNELARIRLEFDDTKKKVAAFKARAELSLTTQLELLKNMDE